MSDEPPGGQTPPVVPSAPASASTSAPGVSPSPAHGDADRALLAEPSRQSPVAVLFIAWRFIRGLGFVQIAVVLAFLFSGRLPLALLTAGVAASLLGLAVMMLAWWRFVFSVDGDELLVSKGILAVERLTIPLDRVQSVSIDQKFLHRPIGLVSVKVDTAGSSTAEFEIDAVERPKAEALQRLASGSRAAAVASSKIGGGAVGDAPPGQPNDVAGGSAEVEEEVIRRTPIELVRIGLTRLPWAGLVAIAPLGAIVGDLGETAVGDFFVGFGERLGAEGAQVESVSRLLIVIVIVGAIGVAIAGVIGLILQVAQSLLTDWNLTLVRTTTGFRRTAGLLNTTSKASTLTRIQAVRTDRTPAQRWVGIRSMTLPTIGEGDLTIPGTTDDELARIRGIVFAPSAATGTTEQTPPLGPPPLGRMISRRWVFLATRNSVFTALPIGVVLFIFVAWWVAPAALLIVPAQWLATRRQWRLRRWGIGDGRLAESLEFVVNRTAELELVKAQTVHVRQSFFERRNGLATVRVGLAEGHLAVPLIPLAEAEAVRDRVLHAVESDRRPWM